MKVLVRSVAPLWTTFVIQVLLECVLFALVARAETSYYQLVTVLLGWPAAFLTLGSVYCLSRGTPEQEILTRARVIDITDYVRWQVKAWVERAATFQKVAWFFIVASSVVWLVSP